MTEPTQEQLTAGARSIGNTMHEANHTVRALKCWQAMMEAAKGIEEPKPKGKRK